MFRHRLIQVGLGLVALVILLLGAAHAPFVRTRVLAWAVARADADLGIQVASAGLNYNLLTLTAELQPIELRAKGAETAFFTADAVRVDLPWSITGGTLAVQSLELDRPKFNVVRGREGTFNLPASTAPAGGPSQPLGPIHIDHLVVRDLDWHYADAPMQMSVDGRGVTLALDRPMGGRLEGRLSMSQRATIRVGERQTTIDELNGRLGFDGHAIAVDELIVRAPEADVRIEGTLDVLSSEPHADVRYAGSTDLARLATWLPVAPGPSGRVTFSGRVEGPFKRLGLAIDLRGEQLAWSAFQNVTLEAKATVSGRVATVESLRAGLLGGDLTADATVPLDANGPGHAHIRWRELDVHQAAAAAAVDLAGLRIASRADGTATLDWTGQEFMAGRGTLDNRLSGSLAPEQALSLEGNSHLTLDRGAWTLSLDHRLDAAGTLRGNVGGHLDARDVPASTITGRASVHSPQINTAIRRISAAGLALDAEAVRSLLASVDVAATVDGTFRSPRATGTLEATDLRYGDVGPAKARADFVATTRHVRLDPARVELGPNVLDARATLDIGSNAVTADATADFPDLESIATSVPVEWRPEGSARVQARVTGRLDNPTAAGTLTSDDVRVAGQTVRSVRASARLENRVVFVDALELTQDVGRLVATGRYAIRDERYVFEATGTDVSLTPIARRAPPRSPTTADATDERPIPIDAQLSLRVAGEGTRTSPSARGHADISQLTWDGYALGSGRVEAVVEQGAAQVTGSLPRFPVSLEGRVQLAAPRRFTASASLVDATLPHLVATASPPSAPFIDPALWHGSLSLHATAAGTLDDLGETDANLDVRFDDVAINGAPVRLERPARLRYVSGQLIADEFELRTGATTLVASGGLGVPAGDGQPLIATLTGSLSDLLPFARLVPSLKGLDASGTLDGRVRAEGAFDAPQIDGELSVNSATLSSGTFPPLRAIALRASYARGLLDLQSLRAEWQGAVASASGLVPLTVLGDRLPESYRRSLPDLPRHARATARISSVTQTVLAPFVDQGTLSEVAGRADLVASIEAASLSRADVTADVTLERADVELARVPIGQTRPTRLRLADGRLSVVEWAWAGAGNRLNLVGGADLFGDAPQLNLAIRGTLDLRMLGAFSRDMVTGGTAALDVTLSGRRDAPTLGGQMLLRDGSVIVRDPRVAVAGLEGTVDLAGDRLVLRDVTATANGGTVRLAGDVPFSGFELAAGTLTIKGRGLALEMPAGLRTEVDTDLQLALSKTDPSLAGTVTILRGAYRDPLSLTNQLLAGVQVLSASSVEEPTEPSLIDRLSLDIGIVSAEDIRVDNNYARLEIASNLAAFGTVGQPALSGRLTFQEGGEVYLGGRTYRVRRGSVDFTSASRIEPDIDLALDTRVQRHDITLQVTGTPDTIEASLSSSSPGVTQADVISLLLTGRMSDDPSGGADTQTEVARGQLLTLLSGEILGFAGRAVGLDTVQVSRGLGAAASTFDLLGTDVDPNTRLTLSKNLARNVELVFSQNLRETGDITWIATYQPLRNFEVRGTTQDDSTRSYEFRHDLDFGGSRGARAPAVAAVSGARPPPSRVAAVTFAGRTGFDERELRRALRHKVGDRFDFYRWQQDRERLEGFYHERGFLEARITAERKDAPSPGDQPRVVLDYGIERGPRTELVVDGYALPGRLVERMERAWAQAVFDGFLIDDLETMATEQLVADGYLQARVKGDVTASADDGATKRIALRIEPGVRFEDRRIVFSGHERLSTEALDLLVRTRGLDVAAWLQPDQLETAIERQYQSLGYLAADVVVDAPVFSQGSATRPVRITEGRPFAIGTVDLRGALAKSDRDVRAAFGLAPGAAYVPASIEPARRAVETLYLRDGYNDARVSVTSRVDREHARINVALAVDEGRQQVLARVELAGAETTSRAVVDRALDLEPGAPANLNSLRRAQKRLYDTGVFRVADVGLQPLESASGGPEGAQPMRAVVRLQELPTYRFRYGFRVSDRVAPTEIGREVQPAFVVDLLRRNLLGRAITTGVSGQVERHRKLARAVVSLPDFLGLPVVSSVYFTRSRQTISPANETAFVDDMSAITAEQRFRPTPRIAVTYGYSFSRSHLFEPDPNPLLPPLDFRASVARVTGALSWDTRDDPANATGGLFQSSGLEVATPSLGSDQRFVRYLAQQYYFKRIGPGVVVGSALRFGAGHDFDTDDGLLQPSDRFRAGGAASVRGFAEDGLGTLDRFGDGGGNGLLLLNQEVRFPIFRWLRGVGFVDLGNVFTRARDLSLAGLELGTGVGVRIHSPFLLLRIDYGVPLTRRDREPAGRWYFGIGQAF